MGTRGTNTMSEGLQKLAQDITALKFTPDADVSFLIGLETQVLQKLREPFEAAAGQMQQANAQPGNAMEMAGAADMGMGAGLMGAGAAMGGPPMSGGMPGGAMGTPGPGGPMPGPLPGARFSPDALRSAMRGGAVGIGTPG